jgi:hypothetical protein
MKIILEPVIWVISNQQWPRAFLCAEMIECGLDAIGFQEVGQALAALGDKATPKPRLIVLDLREQNLSRIEMDNLAHKRIPAIALGGELELNQPLAREYPWMEVIRRPFTIGFVCKTVERLVRPPDTIPDDTKG